MSLPPQVLDCPDQPSCTVLQDPNGFTTVAYAPGVPLYRVYTSTWGYDEANPGFGDARFSPIDDPLTGVRLPSLYLAETEVAALLETVFHEVHHQIPRIIYERDLRGQLLAHVVTPRAVELIDLRDPALHRLSLQREQVASSAAEHYPCTRRLGVELLRLHPTAHGLIWHSRQAEILGQPDVEVIVLFCGDRLETVRGDWPLRGPGNRNLYEGPGRLLIDELAEELDATVELEDPDA